MFFAADKPVPALAEMPQTAMVPVTPGYFDTMGIRMLAGRGFTSADTADSPHVAVINETMARSIWPDDDPIGKRFRHGYPQYQSPWRERIAATFDPPAWRSSLREISGISVTARDDSVVAAVLLLGWLSCRLGWHASELMKQENVYFHTFRPFALDRLVDRLKMSNEWQVVYQNADAVIFRVRPPSSSAP